MKNYYEILNLNLGASESEIKSQFRKLASKHHPDKNGGSKKSEETFKVLLNAYEILSDKNKRNEYDVLYKQYIIQTQIKTNPELKTKQQVKNANQNRRTQNSAENKNNSKVQLAQLAKRYRFWIVLVLYFIMYYFSANKRTTTGNPKADKELEQLKPDNQPQSGEIDFNK